jgi:HEPN domain-containing protein
MSDGTSQRWLDYAARDLAVAKLTREEGFTAHACFCAQQCAEKSLKAYLIATREDFPRIHRLQELLAYCALESEDFSQFQEACEDLDQYYTLTRYPGSAPDVGSDTIPTAEETREAIEAAEQILRFVTHKLGNS